MTLSSTCWRRISQTCGGGLLLVLLVGSVEATAAEAFPAWWPVDHRPAAWQDRLPAYEQWIRTSLDGFAPRTLGLDCSSAPCLLGAVIEVEPETLNDRSSPEFAAVARVLDGPVRAPNLSADGHFTWVQLPSGRVLVAWAWVPFDSFRAPDHHQQASDLAQARLRALFWAQSRTALPGQVDSDDRAFAATLGSEVAPPAGSDPTQGLDHDMPEAGKPVFTSVESCVVRGGRLNRVRERFSCQARDSRRTGQGAIVQPPCWQVSLGSKRPWRWSMEFTSSAWTAPAPPVSSAPSRSAGPASGRMTATGQRQSPGRSARP